jgi:hypothetical protein
MTYLKNFGGIASILLLTISMPLAAQTVKAKKDESRLKGENVPGYAVDLEGSNEDVNSALTKFLKAMGKARQSDGVITLTESTINGAVYRNPVYGVAKTKGNITTAWLGIRKAEWGDGTDAMNKELEKVVKEFGVQYYKNKIQSQIDESNRAAQAVDKQKQRLVTQNKDLNVKLEDNKREKLQLEKSIEKNKQEHELLLKKIAKNKHDQDSVAVAGEQVKKMVDVHKDRQRKVN